MAPIFAVILFNAVVCIIVIVVLVKHTRRSMARKNESLDKDKTVLRLMLSIAGVMSLFGLSWLFGALTITVQEVRIVFEVLFAVFTSLQGFFIFLFFCVLSQVARELWKETLSCGRYKSKILNPNLRFSGARQYRPNNSGQNGARSAATGSTSNPTRETDVTLPRPQPSSDDGSSQHDGSIEDTDAELKKAAPLELSSTAGEGTVKQIDNDSDVTVNRGALNDDVGDIPPASLPENMVMTKVSTFQPKPVPKKRTNMAPVPRKRTRIPSANQITADAESTVEETSLDAGAAAQVRAEVETEGEEAIEIVRITFKD